MIIFKLELLQDMRFARNIHDTTNVNLNIILNLFILNHETKVILNTFNNIFIILILFAYYVLCTDHK